MLRETKLVKSGKNSAGNQRWKCPNCGSSTLRKRPDVTQAGQLQTFLKWLLGKASQAEITHTKTGRSFRRFHQWCWRVTPHENTDLRAIAHGGRIPLSGTLNGRAVSRGYPTGRTPWMQGLMLDASTFITSQMESLAITSIGSSGRGALMAAAFELTKDRRQTQTGQGRDAQGALSLNHWVSTAHPRFE